MILILTFLTIFTEFNAIKLCELKEEQCICRSNNLNKLITMECLNKSQNQLYTIDFAHLTLTNTKNYFIELTIQNKRLDSNFMMENSTNLNLKFIKTLSLINNQVLIGNPILVLAQFQNLVFLKKLNLNSNNLVEIESKWFLHTSPKFANS